MATTSTLKAVLQQLVEETGIGFVIPSYTGTTTTLTLANSYLAGPQSGSRFPIGAPIIVTSTTGLGETTYVSNYVPSTGVITVSPAITTGSTDAILIYPDRGIDHPDRLGEAVNRAINNRLARWQRTELTFVPDGDLRGTTVSDYWSNTATTLSYVTPSFPTSSAASVVVGAQRVLQGVTTNATNQAQSNDILVPLNASAQGGMWYFQTALRVGSGTADTVELRWIDVTNSAVITLNPLYASDSNTFVTASRGFLNMAGTFYVPEDCSRIAARLVGSATSLTWQMAPLVAFPVDAMSFPLPNRIISDSYIGNFYYGSPTRGISNPWNIRYSEPITTNGRTHRIENFGDHRTVTFNFRPQRPVYFDEVVGDPAFSLLTDTTTFPLDHVVKWAKFELFKYLYEHEQPQSRVTSYGTVSVSPSKWRARAVEARIEAQRSDYEPTPVTVVGRV